VIVEPFNPNEILFELEKTTDDSDPAPLPALMINPEGPTEAVIVPFDKPKVTPLELEKIIVPVFCELLLGSPIATPPDEETEAVIAPFGARPKDTLFEFENAPTTSEPTKLAVIA
jgi:hypothetical protein